MLAYVPYMDPMGDGSTTQNSATTCAILSETRKNTLPKRRSFIRKRAEICVHLKF